MWKQWGLFCGEDELKETNYLLGPCASHSACLVSRAVFSYSDTVLCTQELCHMRPVLKREIQRDKTWRLNCYRFARLQVFFNITTLMMLVTNIYFLYKIVD